MLGGKILVYIGVQFRWTKEQQRSQVHVLSEGDGYNRGKNAKRDAAISITRVLMKSRVFFIDLRTDTKENLTGKLNRLLDQVSISSIIKNKELIAVKLHFGEKGNTAFIRPIFIRDIVQKIKACGGNPFLTDANTLYRGERGEAVSHLRLAIEHGFSFATIDVLRSLRS